MDINSIIDSAKKQVETVKNQEVNPDKTASFIKSGASIISGYEVLKTIRFSVIAIIVLIIFIYKGLPTYIGGGAILFLLVFSALEIISFKRIRSVNLDEKTNISNTIPIGTDEKVINYIVGIMRSGLGLRGFEILGAGKIYNPENAILITDNQVIFITVLVEGADKLISGTDIAMWQWLLSKNNIEEKLKDLLASNSLSQIVNMNQGNFSMSLNKLNVKIRSGITQSICFSSEDKKVCYSVRDKNELEKAKMIFANYLDV